MKREDYCEKYFNSIEDLIEGELEERTAAQIITHVFACSECRKEYEILLREKEIYAQYLFEAEPPPDSWTNFQARLNAENQKADGKEIAAVGWFCRRQRTFGFGFSPATAALAALLFVGGIGFVLRQTETIEKDTDKFVAEMKTENSPTPTQSNKTGEKSATNSQAQTAATNDIPKSEDFLTESKSLKEKSNSKFGKKSSAETVKKNQNPVSLADKRKSASDSRLSEERRLAGRQAQNLETEIAGQIEKVELLLRSFRNARSDETTEGFDIEYEKRQARKLLETNARLRRDAEDYGISYAEDLLNRVEPHLLEIANLEINASTDRVLDIKDRVSSQNIIASLQAYSRDAMQ